MWLLAGIALLALTSKPAPPPPPPPPVRRGDSWADYEKAAAGGAAVGAVWGPVGAGVGAGVGLAGEAVYDHWDEIKGWWNS